MVELGIQTDEEVTRVLTYNQPDRSLQSHSVTPMFERFTPAMRVFALDNKMRSPKQSMLNRSYRKHPASVIEYASRTTPLRMTKPSAMNVRNDGSIMHEISFQYRKSSPNVSELLKLPKLQKNQLPTSIVQKRTDHPYRNGRLSDTMKPAKV
mmetsp:Transcript_10213/g.19974  ORF Transcript_10213/g.19974 Transcript_10213/m.19974 type:complete len:152 (-) Transcript_10213:73-528(-)